MPDASLFSNLRDRINHGELSAVLSALRELLAGSPELDRALQQSGRFEPVLQLIRPGTGSHTGIDLPEDQIRAGLLDLVAEIERQGQTPELGAEIERAVSVFHSKNVVVGSTISAGGDVHIGDRTTVTESQTSRRLRLFLLLFVPLLTLGAAYLWYRMQPVSVTVVARQIQPIPDLPFQQGNLVLYHGGKPEPEIIETKVVFTGITREERVSLHFDAPGFVRVDTAFPISGNQLLQLLVRRDSSLMRIAGTVKDFRGNPLTGCQILIAGVNTTSDATGRYELEVPYLQQRREQVIRAIKDGREGFNATRTIVPNEDNDILFQNQ